MVKIYYKLIQDKKIRNPTNLGVENLDRFKCHNLGQSELIRKDEIVHMSEALLHKGDLSLLRWWTLSGSFKRLERTDRVDMVIGLSRFRCQRAYACPLSIERYRSFSSRVVHDKRSH